MAKKIEFNIEIVKKYLFWGCVPIGLLVAVFTGWVAVGSIAADLDKQKKQLESQKTAMERLRGEATNHPNQGTIDEINKERQELAGNVFTAWETLQNDQAEQNRWDGLANRAIQEITSKNFLDPLEGVTLDNYLMFARDEMNKLLEKSNIKLVQQYRRVGDREEPVETIILTQTSSEGSSGVRGSSRGGSARTSSGIGAAGGNPGGGTTILRGNVVWDKPQLEITMKNWTQRPQPFEVWLTQEDLWVYQALLWVVAESNKDVRVPSKVITGGAAGGGAGGDPLNLRDSVVKEIVDLSIGKQAALKLESQSSRRIGGGGGSGGMGSSSYGSGSSGGSGYGSSDSAMGGAMTAESAMQAAMAGRYVDADGSPLMDADLSGQFRRMPIYLCFLADQRRISDILVNCANCPMPIDVLWVTVNPNATKSFEFISTTGAGMAGSGSDSYSSSYSDGGSGRGSSSSRGSTRGGSSAAGAAGGIIGLPDRSGGRAATDIDFGSDAVVIEIFGCINIFTPPEAQKIDSEAGAAGSGSL